MAWTATINSKQQLENSLRVAVTLSNGTTSFEREYFLGEGDRNIDWLKLQLNRQTVLFDTMGTIQTDLALGSFDFSLGTSGTSLGTEA